MTSTYLPQPEAVHNTAWWPEVKDAYEAFVRDIRATPVPDTLTWESDLTAETNRAHWLVIDRLAKPKPERTLLSGPQRVRYRADREFRHPREPAPASRPSLAGSNADSFGLMPGDVIIEDQCASRFRLASTSSICSPSIRCRHDDDDCRVTRRTRRSN